MKKAFQKLSDRFDQKPMGGGGHSHFNMEEATATKAVTPLPGQGQPGPGQMPPKVKNLQYTEPMRFHHPKGHEHKTLRDLGFTGVLDGKIVWTFGDTLMGTHEHNMICATDSTAIGHVSDPMSACDTALYPNSDNVREWIPCNKEEEARGGLSEWAFGGTNIVEIAPNKGLVYYLINHRPGGNGTIKGAGVATCHMGPNNVPEATRAGVQLWNDFEPHWGDVGVAYDPRDDHIYAFGHGPQRDDNELGVRTYLCKAPAHEAMDVDKYSYWNEAQKEWTRQRFTRQGGMGSLKVEMEHAIFGWCAMNQATPFWSNYFNKWMFLHGSCFPDPQVEVRTADKLEGPWEAHGQIASTLPDGKGEGFRYCVCGHPEFDPSGKTVLVTWTRENIIYGVTIEWE
ncbi:MAG: hypothetical protein M1828_000894 [Chrysothrix sp. TS-e1954]|nr:MAG: hypothetical protein M1828_000894 [Chrysothrix sp. TS-e1954]